MKSVQYVASGHDVANKKYSKNINIKSKVKKKKKKSRHSSLFSDFLSRADSWVSCAGALCVASCTWAGRTWCSVRTKVSASLRRRGRSFTFIIVTLAFYFLSCYLFFLCFFALVMCHSYSCLLSYLFTVCRLEINGTYIYFFEILILHFLVGRTNVI